MILLICPAAFRVNTVSACSNVAIEASAKLHHFFLGKDACEVTTRKKFISEIIK